MGVSPSGADSALRFAGGTSSNPARAVSRWKSLSGGKAAGSLPFFVPEEVLHASGMLPVTVWGDEYDRSASSLPWKVLDAWVLPPVPGQPEPADLLPDAASALPRISLRFSSRSMKVPTTEEALDCVERLRDWAGECTGRPPTDGALGKSIRIFNENRRLFSVLGGRLASDPGTYLAREVCWLYRSAMALPREAHSELLRAALSRGPAPEPGFRVKVFLGGRMVTTAAMEAIDAAGAAVVGEALAGGGRTPGSIDEERDPALALARRLRTQILGWVEPDAEPSWATRELDRVEASGADRFLFLGAGAEPQDHCRKLAAEAERRGIPFFCLEGDPSARFPERQAEEIARFLAPGEGH